MKNYSLSPVFFSLLKEYKYYTDGKGVSPLPSDSVREFKIGKKYFYRLGPEIEFIHSKLSNVLSGQYLSNIPINQSATAYTSGKSYLDFIAPHRQNFFFLRLDLRNFFHSIREETIRSNFLEYFSIDKLSEGCEQSNADAIFNLVMYKLSEVSSNHAFKGQCILPMGFPLSPIISNIVFRKIDILIEKFCNENSITYTRYADDMLFSSRGKVNVKSLFSVSNNFNSFEVPFLHSQAFSQEIAIRLSVDGYKINNDKTIKAVHTISLKGYTIEGVNFSDLNGNIRVSNSKTKVIDKLIYELNSNKSDVMVFVKCFKRELPRPKYKNKSKEFIQKYCRDQINNKLIGYKSFLISLLKFDLKNNCLNDSTKEKYNKMIIKLDAAISKRI